MAVMKFMSLSALAVWLMYIAVTILLMTVKLPLRF